MTASFTLIIRTADGVAKKHTLSAGTYTLGREPDCNVVIESSDVSRHHVRLILAEKDFQAVDLGSTLGTKLNGHALNGPKRAGYPAMLQLGSVNISVKLADDEADFRPVLDDAAAPSANPRARVPYEFGNEIARGGMGSILEAEDCKLGRKVAVKIMLSELDADEHQKQRFIHEAAVLARLAHPNIVPVYDIGLDSEGQLYYSMKMVKGRTLQAIMNGLRDSDADTARNYTLNAVLTIFRKVCDAMAFAHSKGIIHRDLKPENIMVGEFGEVLVMDWGLAKFLASPMQEILVKSAAGWKDATGNFGSTMEGDVMGTPQYMSPEQAEGKINEMDARSDIWSLGGILYCILTLSPPVEGKTLEEVLSKVIAGSIKPLTTHTKQGAGHAKRRLKNQPHLVSAAARIIPPALAAVTMKAMTVSRKARYQSVADLQRDIEAYQTGFATSAEKAGWWKRARLAIKRNKAASIGAAAVLLVGTVLGTGAILEGKRAERALTDLKKQAPALRQFAENEAGFQHFESALDKLDAALALEPEFLPAYWRRAWLLIGMERFADAAGAIRFAQQKDPAHDKLAAILPTVEELAALPAHAAWPPECGLHLLNHLQMVGASGEIVGISRKVQLSAKDKQKLVRARLDEWLGAGRGTIRVDEGGLLVVGGLPGTIDTLEPLRGLPIDHLEINGTKVTSLEPLRGMRLVHLLIANTQVADLSPLRGMPLEIIWLNGSKVTDLSHLHGAPLIHIECVLQPDAVIDFSPLRGAPLRRVTIGQHGVHDLNFLTDAPTEYLAIGNNPVTDLTPLRGKPLKFLHLPAKVWDLSPLRGAPIETLELESLQKDLSPLLDLPKLEKLRGVGMGKHLEVLRHHPTLKLIGPGAGAPYRPVAEFWAEYDAKQAGSK